MKRLLVLACAALLTLSAGCFEKSEVRFSVHGDAGTGITPTVKVSWSDGFRFKECTLDSLHQSAGPFSTQSSGTLTISCTVLSNGGTPVNAAAVSLDLKDDWRWGVDCFFAENNPVNVCFGCFGSTSIELDPSLGLGEAVRLFIVWGGNSISNPVIY